MGGALSVESLTAALLRSIITGEGPDTALAGQAPPGEVLIAIERARNILIDMTIDSLKEVIENAYPSGK